MFNKTLRIGTRESQLALWQSENVANSLEKQGASSTLIKIKSDGDTDLIMPLYAIGVQGIFTKTLDVALLENRIDIAVHSLKDVPTQLPKGIIIAAVLSRGSVSDVLLRKKDVNNQNFNLTIGTGSLRRKAQWLNKFPNYEVDNLRGNVQTRIEKLNKSDWHGAIFAKAGLERMELLGNNFQVLDWMIPAPAQGAIAVVCREEDTEIKALLKNIHCKTTSICVGVERKFLNILEGGCTAPIGAIAKLEGEKMTFTVGLFSTDGKQTMTLEKTVNLDSIADLAQLAVDELLSQGGKAIMEEIKNNR
jgi:hydroxymethylbilane synthase